MKGLEGDLVAKAKRPIRSSPGQSLYIFDINYYVYTKDKIVFRWWSYDKKVEK